VRYWIRDKEGQYTYEDAAGALTSIHKLFRAILVLAFEPSIGYGNTSRRLCLSPIFRRIEHGEISERVTKAACPRAMASSEFFAMMYFACSTSGPLAWEALITTDPSSSAFGGGTDCAGLTNGRLDPIPGGRSEVKTRFFSFDDAMNTHISGPNSSIKCPARREIVTRSAQSQFPVATSREGTGVLMIRSEEPAQLQGSSMTLSQEPSFFCFIFPKKQSIEKNRFVSVPLMMPR